MITTVLCYSATSGSSVTDYGMPCWVDMGNVGSNTLLDGANLSKADLGLTCFNNARLVHADLTGAQLQGASLLGADLTEAKLKRAYLQDSDLKGTKLADADWVGANLTGSRFWRASMSSVSSEEWELYPHASLDEKVETISDVLRQIKALKEHYKSR